MFDDGQTSSDLFQFDVQVVKKGFFSIFAHDEAEARRMVNEMDLSTRIIQWTDEEVLEVD